jgi:hypothetical protein
LKNSVTNKVSIIEYRPLIEVGGLKRATYRQEGVCWTK